MNTPTPWLLGKGQVDQGTCPYSETNALTSTRRLIQSVKRSATPQIAMPSECDRPSGCRADCSLQVSNDRRDRLLKANLLRIVVRVLQAIVGQMHDMAGPWRMSANRFHFRRRGLHAPSTGIVDSRLPSISGNRNVVRTRGPCRIARWGHRDRRFTPGGIWETTRPSRCRRMRRRHAGGLARLADRVGWIGQADAQPDAADADAVEPAARWASCARPASGTGWRA